MKITKNKAYIIVAYFAIILTTFVFFDLIRESNYKIWLQYVGWYVIFHMLASLVCLHFTKMKLFSLSGFFLAFSYVFHFGQVMIKAISPNYRFSIVDYSRWLKSEGFRNATELSLIVITMAVGGMLLTSINSKNKPSRINEESDTIYKKMAWCILIISLPLKFIIDFQSIITSIKSGYLSVFQMHFSGIVYQLSYFYIIGVVLLLVAYRKSHKKATLIFLITCLYNTITMISGGRSRAIINILLLVYIYFTVIRKIRIRDIVVLSVIGYAGIVILNAIASLRAGGINSMNELFVAMVTNGKNPILVIMEEFGSTIYTVYQSIVYVPDKLNYSYGLTYFYGLSQIFININGILNDVTIAASFSKHINDGFPMGGTYIGELYYNFGHFASLGGLFIGILVNKISLKIEQYINDGAFLNLSYYLMLFVNIIWWVRAAFLDLTRAVVWGAALIWFIHYLIKRDFFFFRKNSKHAEPKGKEEKLVEMPKVTVLMSVYNTKEEYLSESIESILTQTLTDFEFLIYDDASTDGSDVIINEYAAKDNRIVYLRNSENLGLTRTLNNGLERARGQYVARMDADDISLPTRLEKQVSYMESNKKIMALGTASYIKNEDKIVKRKIRNTDPQYIMTNLFFGNTILLHSSMMLRKDFFETHQLFYNNEIKRAQDYDFWVRVSRLGEITTINEPLVIYRISDSQISSYANGEQNKFKMRIRTSQLADLAISASEKECDIHNKLCDRIPDFEVDAINDWVKALVIHNNEAGIFKQNVFKSILYKTYFVVLLKGIFGYHCSNSPLFNKSKALFECMQLAPKIVVNSIKSKL